MKTNIKYNHKEREIQEHDGEGTMEELEREIAESQIGEEGFASGIKPISIYDDTCRRK